MHSTLPQKLRIKDNDVLLTIHAPKDFEKKLQQLPVGVKISDNAKNYNQVHWFVTNQGQLKKELNQVLKSIHSSVVCWIYYPKGTSKIQTDLTRDTGWESLLSHDDMQWISLISFDDTWSAFGMRLKTEADKKKEKKPKERQIFKYIDPEKKIVRLPEDLAKELSRYKKHREFFEGLSFTNKKEYVEWIVSAKREDTRTERIKGTIERLGKKWKNPRNI